MKRHNARILVVLSLYNLDITNSSHEEACEIYQNLKEYEMNEEYPVDIDYDFGEEIIKNIAMYKEEIDNVISKSLVKYTIDRLSYVDRAIVRLATYEMKFAGVPKEIAINEALLITREYSNLDDDSQVKFNNRLLDNIAGYHNE